MDEPTPPPILFALRRLFADWQRDIQQQGTPPMDLTRIRREIFAAIARARSAPLATHNATPEYSRGYAEAKRDCVAEVGQTLDRLATEDPTVFRGDVSPFSKTTTGEES
jgi:hypothetical protein